MRKQILSGFLAAVMAVSCLAVPATDGVSGLLDDLVVSAIEEGEYFNATGTWTYVYDSETIQKAIDDNGAQFSENDNGTYSLGFNIQVGPVRNAIVTVVASSSTSNIYNGVGNNSINKDYMYTVQPSWTCYAPTDSVVGNVKWSYDVDGSQVTAKGACDINEWDSGSIQWNGTWAQITLADNDISGLSISVTITADENTTWKYIQYDEDEAEEDNVYTIFSMFGSPSTVHETIPVNEINSQIGISHTFTSEITTPATCTTAGTRTYTCSVCGNTYTKSIPATGHSYTSKVTKAATCASTGVRTYTCSACGDTYTKTIAKTSNHTYTSKVTKAATCASTGVRTYTCSVCGDSYTKTIAKTSNHTYTSKVTKAATCTTAGVRTYTCSVCGDTYTKSIAATGHSYTTKKVAATYAAQGYTLHTCSNCGASYKDNYTAKKTVPKVTVSSKYSSTTSAVRINWTKVSGATGYRIYRYNSSTKKWESVKTIKDGSTTTYKQTGLKAGTTYKYKVKAYVKYNGTNYWSTSSSSTITTSTKPAQVTIKSTSKSKTAIKLTWKKVTGASGYQVQRYNSSTKKWVTVKTIKSGSTVTYKNTGLKKGTSYKYRIRAYRTVNGTKLYGKWSSTKKVTTKK